MKKAEILGLRTCIYKVDDLQAAKSWFSKAFSQTPYFDEPFYIGFNIGGFELGLQAEEKVAHKTESILTYWGVGDIEKAYDNFIHIGATEHEKPNNVGGELMVASVKDPWDNIIGLIYNPYFNLPEPIEGEEVR